MFLGHVEGRRFHQKFSLIPGLLAETSSSRCSCSIPTKSQVKTMNVREHSAIRKWKRFEHIIIIYTYLHLFAQEKVRIATGTSNIFKPPGWNSPTSPTYTFLNPMPGFKTNPVKLCETQVQIATVDVFINLFLGPEVSVWFVITWASHWFSTCIWSRRRITSNLSIRLGKINNDLVMRFLHVSLLRHCLAPFWKTLGVFSVASSDSRVFIKFLFSWWGWWTLGPLGDLQPHRLTSYVNSTLYVFVPPWDSRYFIQFLPEHLVRVQSSWHTKPDLKSKLFRLDFALVSQRAEFSAFPKATRSCVKNMRAAG